jgi:hypothetical protein
MAAKGASSAGCWAAAACFVGTHGNWCASAFPDARTFRNHASQTIETISHLPFIRDKPPGASLAKLAHSPCWVKKTEPWWLTHCSNLRTPLNK